MRLLALLAFVLAASTALAQPAITRGGALKKRQFQTFSNLAYYVDPAGNNSNDCMSAATPCASVQSVLNRLPFNIRHIVVINVASGTYNQNISFPPFVYSSAGRVDIIGTLVQASVTTGSPTGAVTAGSNLPTAANGPALIVDSSQSWTPDDLVGKFVEITSGVAAGNICAIGKNTATTLWTTCIWPGALMPSPGDSYVIREAGAVFNGQIAVRGQYGSFGSCVRLINLSFVSTSLSSATASVLQTTCNMQATRTQFYSPGTGLLVARAHVVGYHAIAQGGTNSNTPVVTMDPNGSIIWDEGVVRSNGEGAALRMFRTDWGAVRAGIIRGVDPRYGLLEFYGAAGSHSTYYYPPTLICDSALNGGAAVRKVFVYPNLTFNVEAPGGSWSLLSPRVEGCAIGIWLLGLTSIDIVNGPAYFVNVPTAIRLEKGARMNLNGNSLNFSGVTNELQLDGENFTYSTLTSLTPSVISNSYGTAIFAGVTIPP
jgi:hypothetical protein